MPNADVPRIPNLPNAVLNEVGREFEVYLRENDPSFGPVLRDMNQIIRDSVIDVLHHNDAPASRELELFCTLAARVAVGKLVTSQAFQIEFGANGSKPTETIKVELRPEEPVVRDAIVTNE